MHKHMLLPTAAYCVHLGNMDAQAAAGQGHDAAVLHRPTEEPAAGGACGGVLLGQGACVQAATTATGQLAFVGSGLRIMPQFGKLLQTG
jgi:hypothetical protein